MPLLPDAPLPHTADDALGVAGRECVLRFVDDLWQLIESETGVVLDAHCELKVPRGANAGPP